MKVQLPTALTPAAVGVALWVAVASGHTATGRLPGSVAAVSAASGYAIWRRRGRRWHDGRAILALLPSVACGAWIAVGGLVTGDDLTDARRLALQVGPGIALTGIAATILGYHGRHHPADGGTAQAR
ncbi:MAG: hypothetical protein ACRDM1_03355 [Gaiellaceae bacterium]